MKKILTLFFAFTISFIFTSLIVMSDPDINGIEGLASFSSILGVVLFSFIPFALMCIILYICKEHGTKIGLITLITFSIIMMLLLMMVSQPNLSLLQKVDTMVRSSAFMIFVFILGAFPYWFTFIKKKTILTH